MLAVGFFAALFVVLLFGRVIWSAMGRWVRWQQARRVPATIRELQAERDGLKVERAIMARRLESSVGDMKMRMAEQMAEVSRNRNRILDLTAKLQQAEADIATLRERFIYKDTQIQSLNVQIEENVKAINQAWAKTNERESEIGRQANAHQDLQKSLAERDSKIAELESQAKSMREILAALVPSNKESGLVNAQAAQIAVGTSDEFAPASRNLPGNNFDARFNRIAVGNPLSALDSNPDEGMDMSNPVNDGKSTTGVPAESEGLQKGVSNVLSLVQRMRELQKNIKT